MPDLPLPDRVPLEIYARCAVALGWAAALVRAIARQESAEDPWAIRFELAVWKRYRFASRAAQQFDGRGNASSMLHRWNQFKAMDAVCAEDAEINPRARDAAILAHSIGFSQIMGFNHKHCGFESALVFWGAQQTIEGQASGFVNMVRASPRLVELGRRLDLRKRAAPGGKTYDLGDLSEISSIWNGPGYRRNRHDEGLHKHLLFARKEEGLNVRTA